MSLLKIQKTNLNQLNLLLLASDRIDDNQTLIRLEDNAFTGDVRIVSGSNL
jgi:hypothetical protein